MLLFIGATETSFEGIAAELQKLEPSAIVELFELDATAFGGDLLRFHAGTNGLSQNIVWQGRTYTAFPVRASGFDYSGNGQLPRPKMQVANITGAISLLVLTYDDLLGAKVIRKRTLAKYLDSANFSGINPTADPAAEFPDDIFFIDRKVTETRDVVEFELAAAFDVAGVQLPRRQIIQNVCTWRYRGTECGYAGTNYWNTSDQVVGSLALDACGKRLSSCKLRFGQYAPLPFGAFPSAGLTR
jgi:lambda family phage minor tail protein L